VPQYDWVCKVCQQREQVLRSLKEYDRAPGGDDGVASGIDHEHEWERELGAPAVVRGPGWGGSKGNW